MRTERRKPSKRPVSAPPPLQQKRSHEPFGYRGSTHLHGPQTPGPSERDPKGRKGQYTGAGDSALIKK